MNKQYNCISEDKHNKSVNDILDMMWDDNITDKEMDKLLLAAKDDTILAKIARYQYAKDVMNGKTTSNFVNIAPEFHEKLDQDCNKAIFQKYKQTKLYKAYSNSIKNRSIFWPFSLTAIAVYSLFFMFLSVSNNNINNINSPNLYIAKTEITKNNFQPKFFEDIFYSLIDENLYNYKFTNLNEMNLKYDIKDISNIKNTPKKILKPDILRL